ncbi:sugar phosphate isomerase/epimerase [Pedobacter sp. AK013]|uniref:sugar phosphate isomerase/epimerase family protein n=1 Tax=Pedobacter sp. AK013 TaxID=2723071 RepID=UPI0016145DD9|nr:sugar phosphate isomerase/epimerase family protein [Pedobacter sp. AK013]MBB6238263.1 sugar phosphate isomerase/epimerase [Pedobacter sp. AK013]
MKSSYTAFFICLVYISFCGFISNKQEYPRLGIVSGLTQDSLAYAAGFKIIGESVPKILSPTLTDDQFNANLKKIKAAKCKVLSCNLFYPASIKIAGPEVDEAKVLTYTETVLSRAEQAGVKFIVLGSSGARSIPADYDIVKAKTDFVSLCKKLAQIAGKYKVTILLENLETTETNFITSLKSAAEIVRKVNHQNFRLNADIFHMMREGESPSEIIEAGTLIGFSEIAEKQNRSLPGVMGDDFKPYLKALHKINYRGFIFIEGSIKNAATEIPLAFKYLSAQIAEVYSEKKVD